MNLNRLCKSVFYRPPIISDATGKGKITKIKYARPFSYRVVFPAKGNLFRVTFIVSLFRKCSPLAVFGTIVSIIIYAFNRVLRAWSLSHVSDEVMEIHPTITNLYSPSSVSMKVPVIWVPNSFFNRIPDSVFKCVTHSMRAVNLGRDFRLQAPAGFSVSASELIGIHNNVGSAITETQPASRWPALVGRSFGFGRFFLGAFDYFQFPVNFVRQVQEFWHVETVCLG